MAVQEALILLLRAAFSAVVQLHSLSEACVCVRVAYLLSPPLSLIPLFCLPFARSSTPSLHFPPLPLRLGKGRFSLLFKNTKALARPLVWPVVFPSFFLLVFFPAAL